MNGHAFLYYKEEEEEDFRETPTMGLDKLIYEGHRLTSASPFSGLLSVH